MKLDFEEQLRRYGEAVERWVPDPGANRPAGEPARRRRLVPVAAVLVGAAAAATLAVVTLWPDTSHDDLRTDIPAGEPGARDDPGNTPSSTRPSAPTTAAETPATSTPSTTADGSPPGPDIRPGPDTTGPTDASILEPVTAEEVEAMMRPGAVIENVDITGGNIDVVADEVTIRNFRLDANGAPFGFRSCGADTDCSSLDQSAGFVAEDGEIYNTSVAAFRGSHTTLRRLEVHDSDSGAFVPVTGVTIEGSWWHHLGRAEDASGNGVRFASYSGDLPAEIQIHGNYCDMPVSVPPPYNSSACVIASNDEAGTASIEGNWFNGGNHTVECKNQSGLAVHGNRFGRDFRHGPLSRCPNASGNVWDDSGQAI